MKHQKYEVSDIIRIFGKQFTENHFPNSYQKRVLNALSICRTASLGGHKETCSCCGKERISYNSCSNRHCPKCQSSKQAFWIEDLMEKTLPVKHYHIVFTVPHEINSICLSDSKWFYNLLFSSVWETLRQFGYTRFGVESGAICVLHTWGQNLSLHPHIHCIVPSAGETIAGRLKHIGSPGKFLYPVKQISIVFRSKLMERIKSHMEKISLFEKYKILFHQAYNKPWVVFCEPSLAKADHVMKYLGQYTHRVAITNQRILNVDNKNVTFLHKDYAGNAMQKPITIDGVEFLRRFCLHILPLRFVKIRRYGIYSNSARRLKQKQSTLHAIIKTKETSQQRLKRITGFDIYKCPFCNNGVMKMMEIIPRVRSPVSFYSLFFTY
jgi:hypothetical protein